MEQTPEMMFKERVVAALLAVAGMYAFVLSLQNLHMAQISAREYLLAFLFAAGIVLANQYPIHLLRSTKLSLINLPIFLSAVLLSAPLAVFATGVGVLVANILARAERGLLPRDIASIVGQWMFTAFLGYQTTHLTLPGFHGHASRFSLLLLCTIVFLLLDFIVFSISHSFMHGEPFLSCLKSVIKEGFSLEVIQYLIAILGTLAAYEDIWALILLIIPVSIMYLVFKNIKETRYETILILKDMADIVDLRDIYTGGHSKRVAELVRHTLVQMKISGPEATLIEISARLHDIGKIGVPDAILMKPGKLSPEEMEVMETHPQKGAELISRYRDFGRGALIIMHHHERWDGMGYPTGLKGHEIPFGARLIAVADSFDAMISDRPYRKALSANQALQILLEGRGKQWDPQMVNTFVDMMIPQMDEKSTEALSNPPTSLAISPMAMVSS